MTRFRMKLATMLLASAPVWVACADDEATAPPVPVATVSVTPAPDTVRAGLTVTLTATTSDANGNVLTGRTVTWGSDNTSVATVNASGVVTGVSAGTATITATSEGQSGSAGVTVWVGITGSWTGIIDAPAGMCPLDPSITEANSGAVTGTGLLQAPCAVVALTVTGTNNTGSVPDSVELAFTGGGGVFTFNGTFDGVDAMTGLTNGSGCTDCPTSFTRNSIAPIQIPTAVRREGAAPVKDPFLLGN